MHHRRHASELPPSPSTRRRSHPRPAPPRGTRRPRFSPYAGLSHTGSSTAGASFEPGGNASTPAEAAGLPPEQSATEASLRAGMSMIPEEVVDQSDRMQGSRSRLGDRRCPRRRSTGRIAAAARDRSGPQSGARQRSRGGERERGVDLESNTELTGAAQAAARRRCLRRVRAHGASPLWPYGRTPAAASSFPPP